MLALSRTRGAALTAAMLGVWLLLAGCYGPTSALDAYLRAAAGGERDRGGQYIAARVLRR